LIVSSGGGDKYLPGEGAAAYDESNNIQPVKDSEIFDFLKTRTGLLDGVCISGGEPLIHDDIDDLIDEIKALGFLVKLDTNGSCPDKLEKLINTGKIDFISIDIKNSKKKYAQTINIPGYDISPVEESIKLLRTNTIHHEFRTTVVKEFHNSEDLCSIAHWISGASTKTSSGGGLIKYYLQKFIDSEGVLCSGLHAYNDEEMREFNNIINKIIPGSQLRGI